MSRLSPSFGALRLTRGAPARASLIHRWWDDSSTMFQCEGPTMIRSPMTAFPPTARSPGRAEFSWPQGPAARRPWLASIRATSLWRKAPRAFVTRTDCASEHLTTWGGSGRIRAIGVGVSGGAELFRRFKRPVSLAASNSEGSRITWPRGWSRLPRDRGDEIIGHGRTNSRASENDFERGPARKKLIDGRHRPRSRRHEWHRTPARLASSPASTRANRSPRAPGGGPASFTFGHGRWTIAIWGWRQTRKGAAIPPLPYPQEGQRNIPDDRPGTNRHPGRGLADMITRRTTTRCGARFRASNRLVYGIALHASFMGGSRFAGLEGPAAGRSEPCGKAGDGAWFHDPTESPFARPLHRRRCGRT